MPAKDLLKDKDKKFRLLFEDHPQPMWVMDPETGNFLQVNGAASQLYGYTAEQFRNMNIRDVVVENNTTAVDPAGVAVWRHRTSTGRVIDIEAAVHDISYGGKPAQLAVVFDITGRRHLEDQLRQAQKMEAVGMLAGGVAHDFNNLLTIITGYSQLILNNLGPEDINRHSVEQIMKAGERAAALTKQLLAFSRRQVLQPKILDMNKLVGGLGTMLQRLIGEDIDLRLVLPPDLGRVSPDPEQIE